MPLKAEDRQILEAELRDWIEAPLDREPHRIHPEADEGSFVEVRREAHANLVDTQLRALFAPGGQRGRQPSRNSDAKAYLSTGAGSLPPTMTDLLVASAEGRAAVRELAHRPQARLPLEFMVSLRSTVASEFFDEYEAIEVRQLERAGKHAKALHVLVDVFAWLRDRTLMWGVPGRFFTSAAFGPGRDAIGASTTLSLERFLAAATRVSMPPVSATFARQRLVGPALRNAEDREALLESCPETLAARLRSGAPSSHGGRGSLRHWWDAAGTLLESGIADTPPHRVAEAMKGLPREDPQHRLLKWVHEVSLDRLRTQLAWQTLIVMAAFRLVALKPRDRLDDPERPWLARALSRLSDDYGFGPRSDLTLEMTRVHGRPSLSVTFEAMSSLPDSELVVGALSRQVYVDGQKPAFGA